MSGRNRVEAFIGLGGNIGDPMEAMRRALRQLGAGDEARIVAVSSLYRTPPWGKTDQPDFLNAVAKVSTGLTPEALLDACLDAEASLHRVRKERWGPRLIDLDVLLYGDERIEQDGLEIPHPRMLERAFVMVPLAEIAPELVLDGMTAAERAGRLDATGMDRVATGNWWMSDS